MNNQKKQNSYTPEFKESAAKLAIESDQPVSKTAEELGVKLEYLDQQIPRASGPEGRSGP